MEVRQRHTQQYDANKTEPSQISSNNNDNTEKQKAAPKNSLEDNLAVVAIFFALGVVMHFFASDTNTMVLDGFYQLISLLCYCISFAGAAYGIGDNSKKDYLSLGIGVAFGMLAYGIHSLVISLRKNIIWLAVLLEIVFAVFICIAAYGIVKGIINVLSPSKKGDLEPAHKPLSASEKRERIASFVIALLSLLVGIIQALPIIIGYFQGLFTR